MRVRLFLAATLVASPLTMLAAQSAPAGAPVSRDPAAMVKAEAEEMARAAED